MGSNLEKSDIPEKTTPSKKEVDVAPEGLAAIRGDPAEGALSVGEPEKTTVVGDLVHDAQFYRKQEYPIPF